MIIEKRDNTIDVMKVMCMMLVVIGHVVSVYTPFSYVKMPVNSVLVLVWKLIYSFHMPSFVAISGALFFLLKQRGKYNNLSQFVYNKVHRLLIPYFCLAFFMVIPIMYYIGESISYDNILNNYIFAENPRHLWYLYMLFFIFIISNAFYDVIQKRPMITMFCLFVIFYLGAYFPLRFQLYNIFKYIFYFYLGGVLYENRNALNIKINLPIQVAFLFVVFLLLFFLHEKTKMINSQTGSMLLALSGMILLFYCSKTISKFKIPFYNRLSKNSYGIYLFHPMLNYLIFYYFGEKVISNPYITCIIVSIVITVISVFITEFLRKCKLRFIIGE